MHKQAVQNCKSQERPRVSPGFSVFNLNSPSSSKPAAYAVTTNLPPEVINLFCMAGIKHPDPYLNAALLEGLS